LYVFDILQHLKTITARKGVKLEAPKRSKKDDDEWF
jgi:hypothetical protein